MTDFTIIDEGSFFILVAQTDAARIWTDINLPQDVWQDTRGTLLETRFFPDIVAAIERGGLTIHG